MSAAEDVIIRALRSKNLTVEPETTKVADAKLDGRSADFLHGYHAAMAEVAELALRTTTRLQSEHAEAKPTFFGRPSPRHYELTGGGRVSKEIGDYVFQRAVAAFAKRKGAV